MARQLSAASGFTDYAADGKRIDYVATESSANWDETNWEFDAASGVNTAKVYADAISSQ
ncbi:MAG: hypothetical protein IKK82_02645 [Kiritimatiellae bacterium]|nr:hypothetical protein [Kiritimatiellia bacterium]